MKKRNYNIPWLPISALVFYFTAFILWTINIIPPPNQIFSFLEGLYNSYGLIGLFIATFLEGIVYLGLYFPGSFIILLSVFLSDGSFIALFSISLVVAITLTLTSTINYWLGKHIAFKNLETEDVLVNLKKPTRGLLASTLHPNLLAFHFFDSGIKKQNPLRILYVPFLMILVGLFYAYLVYPLRIILREQIEKPYIMFTLIFIWFTVAFVFENKRKLNKEIQQLK